MESSPHFQMYECQNHECRFRFPSNLSVEHFTQCPICGSPVYKSGESFSNTKMFKNGTLYRGRKIHLLLDNLRSTLNVGSIFRTANCTAIEHIYCCGTTPTPSHPKFGKSGLNSEQTVAWSYHRNALDVIAKTKDSGFHVISLEVASKSTPIFENVIPEDTNSLLLVVGNEISGIDPAMLDLSDSIVYIPMLGSKDSLNVAIAAAISLYIYRFSLVETN
jgi:23S rRNA (guanosine2251-2'-O)-methyltransferase